VRITAEIDTHQRRMNNLLGRRVPGEQIDVEDAILALRAWLMANDAAMMALVAQARQANDRRPERRRPDLELGFRAMPDVAEPCASGRFYVVPTGRETVPP
jgi:hypothetical protein